MDCMEISPTSDKSSTAASQNAAVAQCAQAWQRTHELASLLPNKERFEPEYDGFAEKQARAAFRDAMPSVAGYENIQDFIACTSYATLHGIFDPEECERLLACAKLAMAALRARPPAAK